MAGEDFVHATRIADLPERLKGGVVAIGNFDGVHRGHRIVIDMTVSRARSAGLPALVLTFEPHPRAFFQPGKPMFRLTPPEVKAELLREVGVDGVLDLPFDAALAALTAEDFVEEILGRSSPARWCTARSAAAISAIPPPIWISAMAAA